MNDMNTFQKALDLFMGLNNDTLFYYLNGKTAFDEGETFMKSATRDFFLRQIKIALDIHIYP